MMTIDLDRTSCQGRCEARLEREVRAPITCTKKATHRLDGVRLCRVHAGLAPLAAAEGVAGL